METIDPDAWLDAEIARFAPMSPWPLNMQQVLDMHESHEPGRLAKYLSVEVPVRVAERIRWIEALPGWAEIPELVEVYMWHRTTFYNLRTTNRKRNFDAFVEVVEEAVTTSEDMPYKLAFAMQRLYAERGEEYGNKFGDKWLDKFLLNHIGTNFIMAQFLAASSPELVPDSFAGLIDPHCNVADICWEVADEIVDICGEETNKRPVVKVEPSSADGSDGGLTEFAFVPGYLKVILMEVLKNSCRATADKVNTAAQLTKLPITITVCADEDRVSIRIKDCAGGIPFEVGEHVWSYFYSTTKKEGTEYAECATELAGFGVGLPLSRLFAKYLGGSLRLVSLPGYGTSVHIDLHRVSSKQVEQVPDDDSDAAGTRAQKLVFNG
jgi:hypothetical protein